MARVLLRVGAVALVGLALPSGASGQAGPHGQRVGGARPAAPCVMVDIAGERVGHLDCATRVLEAAARSAQAQARQAIATPVLDAGAPDVRTGVASRSATRQRMGSTFGVSVRPQRPSGWR